MEIPLTSRDGPEGSVTFEHWQRGSIPDHEAAAAPPTATGSLREPIGVATSDFTSGDLESAQTIKNLGRTAS